MLFSLLSPIKYCYCQADNWLPNIQLQAYPFHQAPCFILSHKYSIMLLQINSCISKPFILEGHVDRSQQVVSFA